MIKEIQEHFEKEYPREGCGLIAVIKGKKQWFPCENVADGDDDFVISHEDFMKVNKIADIIGIVHNHPDASNTPSQSDLNNCNAIGIPYYIFSYPDMDLNIVQPVMIAKPLIGTEYVFGYSDCFEAARNYLSEYFKIEVRKRDAYEDDWWLKGKDYFTEEYIKTFGFDKVEGDPKPGDLLIFAVQANVGNHCGIYLGKNTFYHHAAHRLSCREPMGSIWMESLIGVYRYAT